MNLKQSRSTSAVESALNTGSGFALSLACQFGFLVVVEGLPMTWHQNLRFALFMTAVSLARSYLWRRFFESRRMSFALSPALLAVIAERQHQVDRRGYTSTHDDDQPPGDLALAGAAYLEASAAAINGAADGRPPASWPWARHDWRSRGLRADLVVGCALGLAEIEKLDRARPRRRSAGYRAPLGPRPPLPVDAWPAGVDVTLSGGTPALAHGKTPREQGGAP